MTQLRALFPNPDEPESEKSKGKGQKAKVKADSPQRHRITEKAEAKSKGKGQKQRHSQQIKQIRHPVTIAPCICDEKQKDPGFRVKPGMTISANSFGN
ncbi:MAG: hypothetical protein H8E46_06430 [FCB group bacterium]|nr:hypothetical protein [FCB group bacterium]